MNAEPHVGVRVTRRFSAAPERVFHTWLVPRGSAGGCSARPCARRRYCASRSTRASAARSASSCGGKARKSTIWARTYLEIDRPQRLAFTWGIARESEDGSRVSIDIVPLETGFQLTLTHDLHPDWADYASRTEAGWTKMLEALAEALG